MRFLKKVMAIFSSIFGGHLVAVKLSSIGPRQDLDGWPLKKIFFFCFFRRFRLFHSILDHMSSLGKLYLVYFARNEYFHFCWNHENWNGWRFDSFIHFFSVCNIIYRLKNNVPRKKSAESEKKKILLLWSSLFDRPRSPIQVLTGLNAA